MTVRRHDHAGTAIVVGASLSGLMTALALARVGVQIELLERSDDSGRTGAALHVDHDLLDRLTGTRSGKGQGIAAGLQTWHSAHAGLLTAASTEPRIRLSDNTTVIDAGQDNRSAWVRLADGSTMRADIVIGADGHRSTVRARIAPDRPDAVFAGYVIWIGLASEADVPGRWPRGVDFLDSPTGPLLGYPLPAPDGSDASGRRQLGWAWYDASRNQLLRDRRAVVGNVVRRSLRPEDIPQETLSSLAAEARRAFPNPWNQAIQDCVDRHAVIGTPIAEYVPERLVNGRLAMVGDAAHVPTPMTGGGFNASLNDAEALADAIEKTLLTSDPIAPLVDYERKRLSSARGLVQGGQGFSRNFARAR